jgi:quercetin dioxygenase-like cupin family protein
MNIAEPVQITAETLGTGVHRPEPYCVFSSERARSSRMYKDEDISLVIWNVGPGQSTSPHAHPESAHTFYVLAGTGEYIQANDPPVALGPGDCVIIPRNVHHAIVNNGTEPLSYLAFTSQGPNGYSRA